MPAQGEGSTEGVILCRSGRKRGKHREHRGTQRGRREGQERRKGRGREWKRMEENGRGGKGREGEEREGKKVGRFFVFCFSFSP